MTEESLDLTQLFKTVGGVLAQNQTSLNQADDYNHNHGDNMVEIFDVISKSMARKKKEGASSQLAYASQQLRKKSTSGSAAVYAQGLEEAAAKFQGQPVTRGNALNLISTLMGASQPQSSGGGDMLGSLLGGLMGGGATQQPAQPQSSDMLGSLLGGLMGGQTTQQPAQPQGGDMLGSLLGGLMGGQPAQQPTQPQTSGGGDMLGSLLGGLMGGQTTQQPAQPQSSDLLGALLGGAVEQGDGSGIDTADLIQAAMGYFQATQSGAKPLEALVSAVMAGSRMSGSAHRQQSGELVVSTLLQALSGMGGK